MFEGTKTEVHHVERTPNGNQLYGDDPGHQILGDERIELTDEDNIRIRRKTDKRILSILIWVYFLQILDKTAFGFGNIFGLTQDAHLVGNQYSLVSTMNAIAQLGWQPFSSILIVKVPHRYLMTGLVLGWGIAQCCMAASKSFGALVATRFLLGLFEAGCLPLFSIMTATFYRRSEQPFRVAAWYSMNGMATIVAALLSFGLGHVKNPHLHGWQAIYLVVGLLTVISVPIIYLVVDSNPATARFFDERDRAMAIERLRANQTGTGNTHFKWRQALEMFYDTKSWLFFGMSFLLNVGAQVTNAFGPTLIATFGFDSYVTALLNMPFGALQIMVILSASYAAQRFSIKSAFLAAFMIPVVAGAGLLYGEANSKDFKTGPALAGYYLLAFLFAGNPLIVSWLVANTAGQTKKSAAISLYQAGSSAGNIVGPLLFKSKDAKQHYKPGLRGVMGIFIALVCVVGLTVVNLYILNKQRQRQRVKNGKPKIIDDTSMRAKYATYGADDASHVLGRNALLDLTDFKNDEFTYVY